MNEALDALDVRQHRVGDHLRAEHVGLEEMVVVVDRPRDVRLGGEVDDDVRLLDQAVDQRGVAHVAVPELEPAAVRRMVEPAGRFSTLPA